MCIRDRADPLCQALYGSEEAGQYLMLFALLAPVLYCDAVTDAMTKGLGQQQACVRCNILTSALDLALLYWLLTLRTLPLVSSRASTAPEGITAGELGCRLTLTGGDLTMMVFSWAQLGYLLIVLSLIHILCIR